MEIFELYLSPIDDVRFTVSVTQSNSGDGGDTQSTLPDEDRRRITLIKILEGSKFNIDNFRDDDELDWMVDKQIIAGDRNTFHPDYLQKIGHLLYRVLFPPGSDVEKLLIRAIALSEHQQKKLVLRLKLSADANRVQHSRLADYPWELLHDGQRFLCHHSIEVSRYIAYNAVAPRLPAVEKLNVLLISSEAFSDDIDLKPLSRKEREAIRKGLQTAEKDGHISLKRLDIPTFANLRSYLTEHRREDSPHVLHFDGHGLFGQKCRECGTIHKTTKGKRCRNCQAPLPPPQGYLVFEDNHRNADYISAERLGTLLQKSSLSDGNGQTGRVALAVLSACQSGMAVAGESVFNGAAQKLIEHRVPAVVAMQYSVAVESATQFAEQFYRSLGQKNSLAVAVSQAREAMDVEGNQWYRPVLYLRWRDNEGGQLFANASESSEKGEMHPNVPEVLTNFDTQIKTTERVASSSIEDDIKNTYPGTQNFEFTTAIVDDRGEVIDLYKKQNQLLTEDLGNRVILEMVTIPGGKFLMGSPEAGNPRNSEEKPQHLVTIKPFLMSKYPITQAQWRKIARLPKVNQKLKRPSSPAEEKNHPVTEVSWYDAVEFCDRLSQKTDRKYCLPSEAEWEYACRAGTTTPFHFGKTITKDLANYDCNYSYAGEPKGIPFNKTTPVGYFKANNFGLFDMHGNVWEWCLDHWHENYDDAPINENEWLDLSQHKTRVMRGGSFKNDPGMCRSSSRHHQTGNEMFPHVGFRIVLHL